MSTSGYRDILFKGRTMLSHDPDICRRVDEKAKIGVDMSFIKKSASYPEVFHTTQNAISRWLTNLSP